jgi:hypothetical protein
VAATQNHILEQYRKQDLQFEDTFYNDVRDEELFLILFRKYFILFKVNTKSYISRKTT